MVGLLKLTPVHDVTESSEEKNIKQTLRQEMMRYETYLGYKLILYLGQGQYERLGLLLIYFFVS